MLTRLNDVSLLVSLDTIKFIESAPDTIISFINGETVVVKESLIDIEKKVIIFNQKIMNGE